MTASRQKSLENIEKMNKHESRESIGTTEKRITMKMKRKEDNMYSQIVRKLLTLLIVNIIVSGVALSTLLRTLTYTGVTIDLVVSNVCLWLSFGFNDQYYQFCCTCKNCFKRFKKQRDADFLTEK